METDDQGEKKQESGKESPKPSPSTKEEVPVDEIHKDVVENKVLAPCSSTSTEDSGASQEMSETTNVSGTTDQSSQPDEVTRVSETTDTSLITEPEMDNFNIKQAVCSICGRDIPNLFDVIDSRVTAKASHQCERCEKPAMQKSEFMFAERQKSVEEVVIVSDEESKTRTEKIEVVNLENINIKKEGKKRKSKELKQYVRPSKVSKKPVRPINKKQTTADIITLSSSSSTDDENDDVIIEPGFKKMVHGIFMKPYIGKPKPNDVIEKVDITDEDVKHPKYKLYQNIKDKARMSTPTPPMSISPSKSTITKPIVLSRTPVTDSEKPPMSISPSKSTITKHIVLSPTPVTDSEKPPMSISPSKSTIAKPIILSPTHVTESDKPVIISPTHVTDSEKPVIISPTPVKRDNSLSIEGLEFHSQAIEDDDSATVSLETSSHTHDLSNKSIDDPSQTEENAFLSDLVIERKTEEQSSSVDLTESTKETSNSSPRKGQNKDNIDPTTLIQLKDSLESNIGGGDNKQFENENKADDTSMLSKSDEIDMEDKKKQNCETKVSESSSDSPVESKKIESELERDKKESQRSIISEDSVKQQEGEKQQQQAPQQTDQENKIQNVEQTEMTIIPETPPSENDISQPKDNAQYERTKATPVAPEDPDFQTISNKNDNTTSDVLPKNNKSNSNYSENNCEADFESQKVDNSDLVSTLKQTLKKQQSTAKKYSGISAFLENFEGNSSNKMVEEETEEPSLKEQTNPVTEQQTMDEDTPDNKEPMETGDWKSVEWDWIERNKGPQLMGVCRKEYKKSFQNYLRGCYWSPDGSALLTNSDDNILRIFETQTLDQNNDKDQPFDLKPKQRLSEGETVYDVAWYPFMTSQDPDTCCFLSTSRDHPVHLWDSNTGRLRCSYRSFDQMDEIATPHSVSFNADGSKVYCGFNNCIRIFDSSRPGRQFVEKSVVRKKSRSRKDRQQKSLNQRGIVSAIAFSNQYSGLYALGTFTKTVGLYAANEDEPLFLLREHKGGITQLHFTSDGFYLFSGARKDNELIAWDMRNTSIPLFKLQREVSTNQRIQFDIDLTCKYLCSGNTNNEVSVWDINNIMQNVGEEVVKHNPLLSYKAHQDAVNGISIHPTLKYIATTSGQRHFFVNDIDSDDSIDDVTNVTMETSKQQSSFCYDNSLKIWKT